MDFQFRVNCGPKLDKQSRSIRLHQVMSIAFIGLRCRQSMRRIVHVPVMGGK